MFVVSLLSLFVVNKDDTSKYLTYQINSSLYLHLSPLTHTLPYTATINPMQNHTLSRHCLDVGRAMKKVDRTTFLDWAKWCEGVFSVNTAQVLWDFFPPLACDVHCASYSQVCVFLGLVLCYCKWFVILFLFLIQGSFLWN